MTNSKSLTLLSLLLTNPLLTTSKTPKLVPSRDQRLIPKSNDNPWFQITCANDETDSNKKHSLKWFKINLDDNSKTEIDKSYYVDDESDYIDVLSSSLTIKIDNLSKEEHTAEYQCEVQYTLEEHRVGEVPTASQKILVYDMIEFPKPDDVASIQYGVNGESNEFISCQAKTSNTVKRVRIRYRPDGKTKQGLSDKQRIELVKLRTAVYNETSDDYRYYFPRTLTVKDSGKYECIVDISFSRKGVTATEKFYNNVQYIVGMRPNIVQAPDAIKGILDGQPNKVELTCKADIPTEVTPVSKGAVIKWSLESSSSSSDSDNRYPGNSCTDFTTSGDLTQGNQSHSLSVKEGSDQSECNWKRLHEAIYTCTAYFGNPDKMSDYDKKRLSASASGKLIVYSLPKPVIEIKPGVVKEGDSIEITCKDQDEKVFPKPDFFVVMPNGTEISMTVSSDDDFGLQNIELQKRSIRDAFTRRKRRLYRIGRQLDNGIGNNGNNGNIPQESTQPTEIAIISTDTLSEPEPTIRRVLQISRQATSDWDGEIKCLARSFFKELPNEKDRNYETSVSGTINVQYAPKFNFQNVLYVPSLGNNYTADVCNVRAKPPPTLILSDYNSNELLRVDSDSVDEISLSYTFTNTSDMEFPSNFICQAKNEVDGTDWVSQEFSVERASVSEPVNDLVVKAEALSADVRFLGFWVFFCSRLFYTCLRANTREYFYDIQLYNSTK